MEPALEKMWGDFLSLTQKPLVTLVTRGFCWSVVPGGDLLSRASCSLSLARCCFTVLFGKGRGGSSRLLPPSEAWSLRGFRFEANCASVELVEGCFVIGYWFCVIQGYRIKPHGQLVQVSLAHCCVSTPCLSTSWSSTTLKGAYSPGEI